MAPRVKSEYIKTLVGGEFTTNADVSVNASNDTVILEHQVPFKQRYFVGNGRINNGVEDRGVFKIATFKETTPGDITAGAMQIRLADANKLNSVFLREDRVEDVIVGVRVGKGGKTGNEKNVRFAAEREFIQVTLRLDSGASAVTYDASASTPLLPVTIQAL